MIKKLTPGLIYKLFWFHYLIFHTFFSSSTVVPEFQRNIVLLTGFISLLGHFRDEKNRLFITHKVLFVLLNIFPFAIDNRTTVAMFESVAFIVIMWRFNDISRLAPAHRWILGLTLFFAGFHKLNSTHLFASGSCSKFVASNLIPMSDELLAIIPFLAIALEFALAAAIFARWKYMWVLLLAFTIPLSIHGFHQFMALLWVLAVPLIFTKDEGKKSRLAVGLAIAFSVNALLPYLEVKNGSSMNMYSNLIIKDGQTNHYLIPRTLPLTNNLRETVTIIESNYPWHAPGIIIPKKGFMKQLKLSQEMDALPKVTFEEKGKIFETGLDREKDAEYFKDLGFIDYYFMSLGYINYDENVCTW